MGENNPTGKLMEKKKTHWYWLLLSPLPTRFRSKTCLTPPWSEERPRWSLTVPALSSHRPPTPLPMLLQTTQRYAGLLRAVTKRKKKKTPKKKNVSTFDIPWQAVYARITVQRRYLASFGKMTAAEEDSFQQLINSLRAKARQQCSIADAFFFFFYISKANPPLTV